MPYEVLLIVVLVLCIPLLAIYMHFRHKALELKLRAERTPVLANPAQQAQIDALQSEMKEMKHMMQEQMIAIDTLISNQTRLLEGQRPSDLQNRLGQTTGQSSEAQRT